MSSNTAFTKFLSTCATANPILSINVIVTQSSKLKQLTNTTLFSMAGEHMSLGPAHYTLGTQCEYTINVVISVVYFNSYPPYVS